MSDANDSPGLHDVVAELQALLLRSDRVEEFLTGVARAAARTVGYDLACGVSVSATKRSRILEATSDEFAARMGAIQHSVDGPGSTCLDTATVVVVPDIATDPRWEEFGRRTRVEGAQATASVPMTVDGRVIGAVHLYTRRGRALTAADLRRIRRFADQAAGPVGLAIRLAESEETVRHLGIALRSRTTIDQAIGALMGRARINPAEAFDVLRLRSQHTNTKLRDVAAAVLAETARPTEHEPEAV